MHEPLYGNKDSGSRSSCHPHQRCPGWGGRQLASSAVNCAAMVPNASGVSLKEAHIIRAASSLEPLTRQTSGKLNVVAILTRVQIPGLLLGS